MRSNDTDVVFLLGRDRTLRGMLTEDQAARLARQKVPRLEGVETEPVMTAGPDTYVEEIIPMVAETEHPIAVVNERGHLLGEIHRGALLTSMAGSRAGDDGPDSE